MEQHNRPPVISPFGNLTPLRSQKYFPVPKIIYFQTPKNIWLRITPVVSSFGDVSEAAAEWPHVLHGPEPGAGGGPLLALLGSPPGHVDAGPRPLPRHGVLALAVLRHLEDHLETEQQSILWFLMDLCLLNRSYDRTSVQISCQFYFNSRLA